MFSVDYPYAPNAKGRAFLDRVALAPADMAKLTHGNADALAEVEGAGGVKEHGEVGSPVSGMEENFGCHQAVGSKPLVLKSTMRVFDGV